MISTELTGLAGYVHHMPPVVFMYNRQPLILQDLELPDGDAITVTVENTETGEAHTETRRVRSGRVDFDLSGTMRHLAPDVANVFKLHEGEYPAAYVPFAVRVGYEGDQVAALSFTGLYGALPPDGSYGSEPRTLTLYYYYPNAVRLWRNAGGSFVVFDADNPGYEARLQIDTEQPFVDGDLFSALRSSADSGDFVAARFVQDLENGRTANVYLPVRVLYSGGGASTEGLDPQYTRLRLDTTKPEAGQVFLRWLRRDGTYGQKLFYPGTLQTDATQRTVATRYLAGNPLERDAHDGMSISNPVAQDFIETRKLTLGAQCRDAEEFDYLRDLTVSPVVDVYDSDRDTWTRVNVLPGSYARSQKFKTPHTQTFEITIEFPAHDTVTI